LLPPHVFDTGPPALTEQARVGPQLLDARAAGAADGANFGLPPAVARRLIKGKYGSKIFQGWSTKNAWVACTAEQQHICGQTVTFLRRTRTTSHALGPRTLRSGLRVAVGFGDGD
jgi:hypothetical protein